MHADTKQIIARQLFAFLGYKKIEDITVKDLVDACHISRQTFYYHFHDIMDVMEWGARQAVEQARAEMMAAQEPREAVRVFAIQIVQKKEIYRKLMQSQRRAEMERILVDALRAYLQVLFLKKWCNPQLPAADIKAFLDFFSCGLIGLILKNCEVGETDTDLLADQIYRLLTGEMRSQLDTPPCGVKILTPQGGVSIHAALD